MKAVARLDWGRWIADCPNPSCTNAIQLEQGQAEFQCRFLADEKRQLYGGCGTVAPVEWPEDVAGISRTGAGGPDSARNWRPEQ